MAYKTSSYQQFTGFPALTWLTLREMAINNSSIGQYLNMLFHVYSFTEAMLPGKTGDPDQVKKWTDAITKIDKDLDQALMDYDPMWENPEYSPQEANYRRRLFQILRALNNLLCDAKLIDREYQRSMEAPNPLGEE